MRRRIGIVAGLLAGALMGAAPAAGAAGPVSSHAMVHTCCTSYEQKERAFAESKVLGAALIRVDVELGPIFDSFGAPRSQPDWRGLDDVVELSRRYELPVLGIVLDTPAFASECPERWPDAGRCAARDPVEYGRLAGEVAARARGTIGHWEVINEPDGPWAFEGTAEQYARMLAASHDAIKARVPEATVVMGGVMEPYRTDWVERVFATPDAGAARKFDVANVHLRGPVGGLPNAVRRWRELLGRHGFEGPLWVTEHGYSADPAFQQDPAFVGGEGPQAAYLKRSLLALTEAGAEQVFVTLRDNAELEPNYVHEGLAVLHDGEVRRRPAFAAVADFARRYPEIRELLARQRGYERRAAALAVAAQADERRLRAARSARDDVRGALVAAQLSLKQAARELRRAARAERRARAATRGKWPRRRVRAARAKTAKRGVRAARRAGTRARRRLAYAQRVVPRLRKQLLGADRRVRAHAQRLAGNRVEASQHAQSALDCARLIEG